MNESPLYFDHCTATPCTNKVKETLFEMMLSYWASPWAPYHIGQKGVYKAQESLSSILSSLKAGEEKSFFLTHSGAEATVMVLNTLEKSVLGEKKHIIASLSERLPVMHALDSLRRSHGIKVDLLPVGPKGFLEKEAIEKKISKDTALVLLPYIDPFSGVLQPIDFLYPLLQRYKISLALDVTYALGKTYLSLKDIQADYITFDARLLGSPIDIGGLLVKKGHEVLPLIRGDIGSSDMVLRLALLATFLESIESEVYLFCSEGTRLRDLFEVLLKEAIPDLSFLYQEEDRISSLSTAFFPKVKNEALLYLLQKRKLFASIGGADIQSLSSQLFERGYSPEKAQGAMRFSFSHTTKEEEIIAGVRRIKEAHEVLFNMSKEGIF